jgi:hypothetical protein
LLAFLILIFINIPKLVFTISGFLFNKQSNKKSKSLTLPLLAIVLGLADGFNPCAMWILIFLISFLLTTKDTRKMWILGLTFLITSALVYAVFMTGWLKLTLSLVTVGSLRNVIGVIAITVGLYNLYNYYKTKDDDDGCKVTDKTKRKHIAKSIKKYVNEKHIIIGMLGMVALAISVNFIELACSAGFPLIFVNVLALNDLNSFQYMFYIFIYILFFLLDDLVVFFVAMTTFKITGLTSKYTKYSHLVGGALILIVGFLLIFAPELIMFG